MFPPTFTYDGRNYLVTVSGYYLYETSHWNAYTYDEKSRLIFKSFTDEDRSDCGNGDDE